MEDQKLFYWLKLHRDFFKRHDIKIVEAMPNGDKYILFYMKLLCESIDHNGYLRFSDEVPYNEEMLSVITGTNVDVVRSAVKVFLGLKMMELMDDGTYYMRGVERMIGSAANNDNANRQRRFRERQKQALLEAQTDAVTENNALVTEGVTDDNERKSKSIEIDIEEQGIESKEVTMSDGLTEEKKESKGAGACESVCLDENKQALDEFLFVCDVTVTDVYQDQDRPTQERLGHFLADFGKSLACKRTVLIEGQEVPVADVLDYFRTALETGEKDELFVSTIREVSKKVIEGKVRGNQEGYLVSALYGRIKAGGAV